MGEATAGRQDTGRQKRQGESLPNRQEIQYTEVEVGVWRNRMHKRIRHRPIRLYPYALNLPLWSFPLVGPSPTPLAPRLPMPNLYKSRHKLQPRKIYLVPLSKERLSRGGSE